MKLPQKSRLFTADAVGMYSNIDLNLGIQAIRQWLDEESKLPQHRIDLTIALLTLIMNSNVFQCEDTFWLQLIRTAMGTSCAVTFATICYLLTERIICSKFGHRLAYFKRFIDAILGVWLIYDTYSHDPTQDPEWTSFQAELNTFGRLRWTVGALLNTAIFLDLNITLGTDGSFSFKTYKKELNLHLYIPAVSAYSPDTLKGMIYGNLQRYWRQNKKHEDYISMVQAFGNHLTNRGHDITTIITHLKDAANHIAKKESKNPSRNEKPPPTPRLLTRTENDFFSMLNFIPKESRDVQFDNCTSAH
jgi:hypothetical protein